MKRQLLALVVLSALLVGGLPAARAQTDWPPTIFLFTSDVESVTVAELESGDIEATLHWHVAHVGADNLIQLHTYLSETWVPLADTGTSLPPVGDQTVTLEHPGNFGPATFRLSVLDSARQVVTERVLVIPYAQDDRTPSIFSFSALDQTVSAADLTAGTARVRVSWVVRNRPPHTHIMFEQVIGEDTVNVELPRPQLYVPSQGSGVVAPVAPSSGAAETGTITLRLVVIDVISADILDQAEVEVTVIGTALPPEGAPATPEATEEPTPSFGALTMLETCTLFPPGVPERGWIDSPGFPSPNGRFMAYVTNGVGDAELVIENADGSGQVVVPAPDFDNPLWSRPRWSPDSTRIAFNNIRITPPGGGTIYAVNMDGTDLRELATYIGYYDDIAWSEDGEYIYFTSGEAPDSTTETRVTNYRIFRVSTDGLGTPEAIADGCGVLE